MKLSSYKETRLIPAESQNKVVFALLILSTGWLFSILAILILLVTNYTLAKREKIYVQQTDGTTLIAQEFEGNYRQPQLIQETVRNWTQLTMEWDNRIPGTEQTDPGVLIDNNKLVPSKAYLASYLLEDGFRREFLLKLAELVPAEVYRGQFTSNLRIYHISEPRQLSPGIYEVDLVATRIDLGTKGEKQEIKFNRTFTLQAIEPYSLVLGKDEPSAFRQQLYQLLMNGLLITKIVEFKGV